MKTNSNIFQILICCILLSGCYKRNVFNCNNCAIVSIENDTINRVNIINNLLTRNESCWNFQTTDSAWVKLSNNKYSYFIDKKIIDKGKLIYHYKGNEDLVIVISSIENEKTIVVEVPKNSGNFILDNMVTIDLKLIYKEDENSLLKEICLLLQ